MESGGSILIWNADKIRAKANAIGGIIAKEWGGDTPPFSVYLYRNPLASNPAFIFVTYNDPIHNDNMLAGMHVEGNFTWFESMYRDDWAGMSMDRNMPHADLIQFFDFCEWCYQNALIAEFEVWT